MYALEQPIGMYRNSYRVFEKLIELIPARLTVLDDVRNWLGHYDSIAARGRTIENRSTQSSTAVA